MTSCGVCCGDLALRRMKGEIGQNIYNIIGQNSKQNLMNLPDGRKNMSDASCSILCIDGLWATQRCIAYGYECMMHNFFEIVEFSNGKEEAVDTKFSPSSSV